jgi:ketosteroid isomerase-like protein
MAMLRIIGGVGVLLLITSACAMQRPAGRSWEQEIRAAEQHHLAAFASNDPATIDALFSDDFLVNSPRYDVLDKRQLMDLVRRGTLKTSSFSQSIDQIRRYGDVAVVMGADRVVFAPPAPNAGRTINRRFTEIWRFQDGQWRFVARHANPICE